MAHPENHPSLGPKIRGIAAGLGTSIPLSFSTLGAPASWARAFLGANYRSRQPWNTNDTFSFGCPLRCLYCHNPDTMGMREGTIEKVDDVILKVLRYKRTFSLSGGSLTISGGEPLFQTAFTKRILQAAHQAGIHTTIDTSGFLGARLSDTDLADIDLVSLDVKSGDPKTYHHVTGQKLQPTIDFGNRLTGVNKKMWIRFILVPGLTNSMDNVLKVRDIISP